MAKPRCRVSRSTRVETDAVRGQQLLDRRELLPDLPLLGGLCQHHSTMMSIKYGLRLRSAIMAAVYRKCLRLSSTAVKEQSSENNSGVNRSPNLTEQSCESEVALAAEDEIQDHGENSTTLSSIDNI